MDNDKIKSAPISPISYGLYQMEKSVTEELQLYCEELLNDPYRVKRKCNKMTNSHVELQFSATKEISSIVVNCAKQMAENIFDKLPSDLEWIDTPAWINYLKKHEFIAPTELYGNDLAFFCIVKVPFDIHAEMALPHIREAINPHAAKHSLFYADPLGKVSTREFVFNKEDEGVMVLYPSNLMYTLSPFYTSDDHYIVIQGSLVIDTIKEEELE